MAERHLPLEYLATALQTPITEAEALLAGRGSISADRAKKLSAAFGASARFWLTREAEYVEDQTRVMAAAWSESLPLKQMRQFGWIKGSTHWRAHISQCLDFFGVEDFEAWQEQYPPQVAAAHYRKSATFSNDANATLVWFRAAERELDSLQIGRPFDPDRLKARIPTLRRLARHADPKQFVPELQHLCADAGLALLVVRAPGGCRASGATRWIDGRPIVQLSARHLSDDYFWFTLAHELGHVLCHGFSDQPFIDIDFESSEANSTFEDEADRFAESMLLGDSVKLADVRRAHFRDIIRAAATIGTSPGILLGQLQHRGLVSHDRFNGLKRRYHWEGTALTAR